MIIEYSDFNGSDKLVNGAQKEAWEEVQAVIESLPLHLKESDQAGIAGTPIFDVVGTNEYLKKELVKKKWADNIPIPKEYSFLGTDIDFGKNGVILEAQFSNYPFLLNNVLRSELFYKAGVKFSENTTQLIIIVTKAHMFPASNSTLYYEQGHNQLTALAKNKVFDVPIRLVGLFEKKNSKVPITWTKYAEKRYSRTVVSREEKKCDIQEGSSKRSRCKLNLV